jgi:flavin reductase
MTIALAGSDAFRHAMRHVAATVIIISTRQGGQNYGMTATAFAPVTMAPPSLLIAINESASIHDPLAMAETFCVNILTSDQEQQSRVFSSRALADERFTDRDWQMSECGLPYLSGAQANLFCRLQHGHKVGTHTVFIGAVEHVLHRDECDPLIYLNGGYLNLPKAQASSVAA